MPNSFAADSYQLESVKICGITSLADRDLVANAGADYFGALVDVGYSPRSLSPDKAKSLLDDPPIPGVVLMLNEDLDRMQSMIEQLEPFAVQLLGHESPESVAALKSMLDCQVWKSLHIPAKGHGEIDLTTLTLLAEEYEDAGVDALILTTVDASCESAKFGGTGMVSDWGVVRGLMRGRMVPDLLGGGLTPENLVSALHALKPSGIDVCTGVESSVGRKDAQKLARLFEAVAPFRPDRLV